jgi:putative transposase
MGPESPQLLSGDEWPFRLASRDEEWPIINTARKVIVGPIRIRLEQSIQEVAAERGWTVIELAIQPDHVHLFIRADPNTLPSEIPRRIRGRSSRYLRDEFPQLKRLPSLWTRSFFLSTVGDVSQETMRKYIERQSKT